MRTAVLLSTLALAGMASAQVFQSGFEDWTGTTPDGWMGSKSSIDASSVTQVTDNVHGGSSAVRLQNETSSHKRFTTQPLTVEANVDYSVSFWVRGTGEIRVGLFDDRATGSGYATYSPYTSATSAWTQVTQTITSVMNTDIAQFILSVRNTAAPEHLVVDDVEITTGSSVPEVTIHDIQFTTDPSGDSPYNGQVVSTSGIVTGTYITYDSNNDPQYRYTFLQDGSGAWNGIVIYDYFNNNNESNIGDALSVVGTVDEFNNLTELKDLQGFTITATGQAGPAPLVVETGDVSTEALESVLVEVQQATCTVVPSGATFGKWNVNDGSGDAVIGKVMYTVTPEPMLGQVFNVTGVNSFGYGEFNIQPRMASDVDIITGITNAGVLATMNVGPNPAQDMLYISLGDAAGSNVDYTFTDLQGRTLQAGQISGSRAQLSVNDMPTGLYHLTLRSNELVKTFAVQVVR